ncbi:hypothetical protein BKD30_05285 [Tersicoccus phoenicis]|uniref:Rhodanese domain-containing protein n=1 Tax=Tersicoccus phoenicis TaxID=554083 RepID=A0A1R1LEL8_9MICC|nr:hypothetical protein BKD30_05285 [Tersicoccus phoenicis]
MLGALCGIVGSVMALEAIKLITGCGEPLIGRLAIIDSWSLSWSEYPITRDPERSKTTRVAEPPTTACHVEPVAPSIDVAALQARLESSDGANPGFELIDVREPNEWEIVHIPGSRLIPKDVILSGDFDSVRRDQDCVLICKSGVRSTLVANYLRGQGFGRVMSVEGGIIAWTERYAPHLNRY